MGCRSSGRTPNWGHAYRSRWRMAVTALPIARLARDYYAPNWRARLTRCPTCSASRVCVETPTATSRGRALHPHRQPAPAGCAPGCRRTKKVHRHKQRPQQHVLIHMRALVVAQARRWMLTPAGGVAIGAALQVERGTVEQDHGAQCHRPARPPHRQASKTTACSRGDQTARAPQQYLAAPIASPSTLLGSVHHAPSACNADRQRSAGFNRPGWESAATGSDRPGCRETQPRQWTR